MIITRNRKYSINFKDFKGHQFNQLEGNQDWQKENLEAFTVDNGWTRFIVFLLADPHGLEG